MSAHPDPERLSAWEAGELPAAEAEAVQAHVAACPACRARTEGLRSALEGLRALPRVEAPPTLERRLRRRLRRGRRPQPPVSSRMPVLIAATTVALILASVVLASGRILAPTVHPVAPGASTVAGPLVLAAEFGADEAALRARLLAAAEALGAAPEGTPDGERLLSLPESALSDLPPDLRARLAPTPLPPGAAEVPPGRVLLRVR